MPSPSPIPTDIEDLTQLIAFVLPTITMIAFACSHDNLHQIEFETTVFLAFHMYSDFLSLAEMDSHYSKILHNKAFECQHASM